MTTTDQSKRTELLGAVTGFLAGLAVLGMVAVLWQTFETTQAMRSTQLDSKRTVELIESCTTPDGECAQRGAESTGAAIDQISANSRRMHELTRRYAAAAAACADRAGTQTTEQIASCIRKVIQDE